MSKQRITIGVFIDWIESSYHIELISTLEESAKKLGINLLILVGGAINSSRRYEALCNVLYDFVDNRNVDGILLAAGSMGHYCSTSELVQFCKKYDPIPVVSISQSLPGIVSIVSDNSIGLKKLINHLIADHKYRRIGFIKGIDGNQDADQRFEIYKQTLKNNGIDINAQYIAPGDFTQSAGKQAVRNLSKDNKCDLEVIVAANDEMAIGALEELKKNEKHIPLDIAVVGFDDQPSSATSIPPLTTVKQNIGKQGCKALEVILDILSGKKVKKLYTIPTEPVIRQSCGCNKGILISVHSFKKGKIKQSTSIVRGKKIEGKKVILTKILDETNRYIGMLSSIHVTDIEKLIYTFFEDIETGYEKNFVSQLNKVLAKTGVNTGNVKFLIDIVTCFFKTAILYINNNETLFFLENIFFKVQFLIRTILERVQIEFKSEVDHQLEIFSILTEGIAGTVDIKSLMKLLDTASPQMNIKKCYFSIFNNEDFSKAKLLLAYDRDIDTASDLTGIIYSSIDFLPDHKQIKKQQCNLRVHPFLRDGVLLGFTLFEFFPSHNLLQHLLRKMFLYGIIKGVYIYESMKTESERLEALVNERTSDLKQAEARLRQANDALKIEKEIAINASKIKSEFLANMSHEIRTPLNSILGFADILKRTELNIDKKGKLNIINNSGQHLLNLINDILDFSKIEADKIEFFKIPFSIENMLSNIRNMFMLEAYKKNLVFTIHIDTSVPVAILGDERRLQQVIVNLLGNAFKFTHHGSVIIDCSYNKNKVSLSITDTGIGIPKQKQEHIFEAFNQADPSTTRIYGGTGLGLTIAKNLVEKMGGKITLKSKPGKGSSFTIRIPYKKVKKSMIGTLQKGSDDKEGFNQSDICYDLACFKILVAEDTRDNQLLMQDLLSELKVSFEIVSDGMQVLKKLKEKHFDLLLLDIQMPIMDGMETLAAIRSNPVFVDLPVIALTAHSLKGDEEKFLNAGCDDYIAKPIDIDLFYRKVIKILQVHITQNSPDDQKKNRINKRQNHRDIRLKTEKHKYFNNLYMELIKNCDLFYPQDVQRIALSMESCLDGKDAQWIINKIRIAADSYDDDLLLWLMTYLKRLL